MRRFMCWQFLAVLAAGVAWSSCGQAGEYLGRQPPRSLGDVVGDWWSGLVHPTRPIPTQPLPQQQPPPQQQQQQQASGVAAQAPRNVAMVDQAALIQKQEQQALLRRLATCDKFMQVALENRNEALQRQAEEMNDRAWRIYRDRMASLGGNAMAQTDANALDRRLGSTNGNQLVQPARGQNQDPSRQAAAGGRN